MAKGILCTLVVALWIASSAEAITKVGNGDDGSDLEGLSPILSGPLVSTRKKALKLLDRMNVKAVPGLSLLRPELATTQLFIAGKNVKATLPNEEGSFHLSLTGQVYARTFATPHAATRFFPIALGLSEEQLISLHIHEALHRSLPESIREDESAVSDITLAITSPDASFDQIVETTKRWIPEAYVTKGESNEPVIVSDKPEQFTQPSSVGYTFRQFVKPTSQNSYPIKRMHLISSDLYPFGKRNVPFGFGIQLSYLQDEESSYMGPLVLSAKMRIWSVRDFSVSAWTSLALNTLSADEAKNSPFGRDVLGLGLIARKDIKSFYIENTVGYYAPGEAKQKVSTIDYTYSYGAIWDVKLRTGYNFGLVDAGVFGELHLANSFKVEGGAFSEDLGRYRIFSAGPEITLGNKDFSVSVQARYLLDSTKGANYDFLGDLMGPGLANGSVSATLHAFF